MRKIYNMDLDWRFHIGDEVYSYNNSHAAAYGSSKSGRCGGMAGLEYADNDWKKVDLPHDYFTSQDIAPENSLPHGFRTRSNAWYRKSFLLDESARGKTLTLVFEGIAGMATIYFNGFLLTKTKSTYTETIVDITDFAYFGDRANVISVFVDASGFEGWWYEGAGIYRHVRLYEKSEFCIDYNGIFAKPVNLKGEEWNVELNVTALNTSYKEGIVTAKATLYKNEKIVASGCTESVTIPASGKSTLKGSFLVSNPLRWDVDSPNLYSLKIELIKDGVSLDSESVNIGFRTFSVDPNKGFFLNGRRLLIKGTCNHQDHAGVGVALSDSLNFYRIKRLKEIGTNAYRCAHNMPSKEILDACDELGMIVMDENRHFQSDPETLMQVENMVRRDCNHPSVIFWSLFNEEPLQNTEEGARIFKRMKTFVKSIDDSRLITGAINGALDGSGPEMDITGLNYFLQQADIAHEKYPEMTILGSENNSAVSTRGCYESDREEKHVLNGYDEEIVPWGTTVRQMWQFLREHPYFAGIFVWTGFDYRGEPTPFGWPSVSSQFGILDTCGFAKDSFYYNKACFTDEPMVYLLPHWNWEKGKKVRVVAVTNCDEVELFLNGKSLGKKTADVCEPPEWSVEFEEGVVVAKAYRNGKLVSEYKRATAGKPYKIKLTADRPFINNDGQDTVLINAEVVDENGVVCPYADNLITFTASKDGKVLGTGNGDPNSHEIDSETFRHAYCGMCQAVVRLNENGTELTVEAFADGLEGAEISVDINRVEPPLYMRSAINCNIGGVTVSETFKERPDPNIKLADNDMNSFTPIPIPISGYQSDFVDGWRIYRLLPTLPTYDKTKSIEEYTLNFANIKGSVVEVYIDGKLVTEANCSSGGEILAKFSGTPGEIIEIRVLIKAVNNNRSGISNFIKLYKE